MTAVAATLGSDVGDKLVAVHEALDVAGILHAFGGAIALAYAVPDPRTTNDLDINIAGSVDDAAQVLDALPEEILARPDVLETIRRDGQDRLRWGDVPIDLFFPQHRFHAAVQARATQQPFRSIAIPVVTATHLTVFKTLFNRSKDWPDIESMLRAGAVDEAEALRWVEEILGVDHPSSGRLAALIREVHEQRTDPPAEAGAIWAPIGRRR